MTFACGDVAATAAALRAKRLTVTEPATEQWGTYCFVDGPDGHRLRFSRNAEAHFVSADIDARSAMLTP